MSKELEAFERIKATIKLNVKDYLYWEEFGITIPLDKEEMFNDLNLIREVLKRNEPMKVIKDTVINGVCLDYNCPCCKERIDNDKYSKDQYYLIKHCISCGQKVDWSDEK